MVTTVKIPEGRLTEYLTDFANRNVLCYIGLDLHPNKYMKDFEKLLRFFGYPANKDAVIYYVSGITMNEYYRLHGVNRYPDDLTIAFIPDMQDSLFKVMTEGEWFGDVVAKNFLCERILESNNVKEDEHEK